MTYSPDLYCKALRLAAAAHNGQTVRETGLPYLVHVVSVCAELVASFVSEPIADADLAVQCALLHDTVEDTDVTVEHLTREFGAQVAAGVWALSKDPKLPSDEQMTDSLARIQRQPRSIWKVKLADRIANLDPPPRAWTPQKIVHYREEAEHILALLGPASPFLSARMRERIATYRQYEP